MPNPNQANLPVSKREKEFLDYARQQYEQRTNGRTDWGGFAVLGALALLAGLGIAIERARQRQHNRVAVCCPHCDTELEILLAGERLPIAERYNCPECGQDFIVQFQSGVEGRPL